MLFTRYEFSADVMTVFRLYGDTGAGFWRRCIFESHAKFSINRSLRTEG